MPTPAQLQAAVPHIVHDVLTVRQAKAFRLNKFGWIAWYPMARNVAKFLEVFPTSKGDIRASQFFDHRSVELKQWEAAKAARRRSAPPALKQLSAELGIPESTAKTQLYAALRRLETLLPGYGPSPAEEPR